MSHIEMITKMKKELADIKAAQAAREPIFQAKMTEHQKALEAINNKIKVQSQVFNRLVNF